MKRIIQYASKEFHLVPPGTVSYDGLEDFITHDDEFDHTAKEVIYAAIDQPTEFSLQTVLKEADPTLIARHTFSGWEVAGSVAEAAPAVEVEQIIESDLIGE